MKNFLKMSLALTAIALSQCATSRVIQQTDTTAVIQGVGPTDFEAKLNATKKAEDILGGPVAETQKSECNQEYRSSGHTTGVGATQQYKESGGTYYSCVLYFQKK
jgi:hypothetical protein